MYQVWARVCSGTEQTVLADQSEPQVVSNLLSLHLLAVAALVPLRGRARPKPVLFPSIAHPLLGNGTLTPVESSIRARQVGGDIP